jgi:hypothetical protein
MKKLIILFQIRLTETNPAPPILHAINIEGILNTEDLQAKYKWAVQNMRKEYKNHKSFKRIGVFEDLSDRLTAGNVLPPPNNATEIE